MRFQHTLMLTAAAFYGSGLSNYTDTNLTVSTTALADFAEKDNTAVLRSLLTTVDDKKSIYANATEKDNEEKSSVEQASKSGEERSFCDKLKNMFAKVAGPFKSRITPNTFDTWAKNKKSSTYVFKKLGLHKTGNKLFEDPDFEVWRQYVNIVTDESKFDAAIATTLMDCYPAGALYKMLETAKSNSKYNDLATNLQRLQIKDWLNKQVDPGTVFKSFDLDQEELNNIMANPYFLRWSKYLDAFNKDKELLVRASAADAISNNIPYDKVINWLIAGTTVPETQNLAKKFLDEEMELWVANNKPAADVFKIMNLNADTNPLFSHPNFTAFMTYASLLDQSTTKKNIVGRIGTLSR